MCFPSVAVRDFDRWNWDGDEILHRPVVSSSRTVLGYPSARCYETDPRGFLGIRGNAVIARALHESVRNFLDASTRSLNHWGDWEYFRSHSKGAFDFKVDVITAFVAETIAYQKRLNRSDPWLLPEETLHLGHGDCEDRALLLASLLMASGISNYNIRVALGQVRRKNRTGRSQTHDHVWVVYKNECGKWLLLEPTPQRKQNRQRTPVPRQSDKRIESAEYIPFFLFNADHVWVVRNNQFRHDESILSTRRRWADLNPQFIGEIHQTILNEALSHLSGEETRVLDALNRRFSRAFVFFGPIIDAMDRGDYDPLDHFDNGHIEDGWNRVDENLGRFRNDCRDTDAFAQAAHAIADFYAHSSWPHFAKVVRKGTFQPRVEIYDHLRPREGLEMPIDYGQDSTLRLDDDSFSVNPTYFQGTPKERLAAWQGKIITGRYAQRRDSHGVIESLTYIPRRLLTGGNYVKRGALPHHEEIAVDSEDCERNHKLYSKERAGADDRMSYSNQFEWRKNAAMQHIRRAFDSCWP